VASRHGFSGLEPPGSRTQPSARRERLVRMTPPANDNRGQGFRLGRLRFTGLRLLFAALLVGVAALLAAAMGVI
jgi:hypothetical protein